MSLKDMGITPREGTLQAEIERLNKENDDWHEASKQLREIIDAQAKVIRDTGIAHAEEAAAARLALDVALKEVENLRMQLAAANTGAST